MLEVNGRLRSEINELIRHRRIYNLYSPQDSILNWPFKLGEIVAWDGFRPEAIGLNGNPHNVFSGGRYNTQLNHGDYWSDIKVAKFLINRMGIATRRDLLTRAVFKRKINS